MKAGELMAALKDVPADFDVRIGDLEHLVTLEIDEVLDLGPNYGFALVRTKRLEKRKRDRRQA